MPVTLGVPFPVPPFDVAKEMFFPAMTDAEALPYYEKLRPESPQAVWRAPAGPCPSPWTPARAQTFVVAAAADSLTPPRRVRAPAALLGARYTE